MEKYRNDIVKTLSDWIKVPSFEDEKTKTSEHPFGLGPYNSLKFIYDLAIKDGFEAKIVDGYVVEVNYKGEDDDYILVVGHGDVVPVDKGWEHDPFGGEVENNVIYGRGANDDKGPSIAAYYALKAIKDQNIKLKHSIKFMVGSNEENGMGCLKHYFLDLKSKAPKFGFTPDGDFPFIYSEMKIATYEYYGSYEDEVIESFKSGICFNVIPDRAEVVFKTNIDLKEKFANYLKENSLKGDYEIISGKTKITLYGKSSHATLPNGSSNALVNMLVFIGSLNISSLCSHFAKLVDSYDGSHLGIAGGDQELGNLMASADMFNYENDEYKLVIDVRYPPILDDDKIETNLNKASMHHGHFLKKEPAVYQDLSRKECKELLAIYQEESGDYLTKPFAIAGGTYAKYAPNCIAYGMNFPTHLNNGTGNFHMNDEGQNIDDLMLGAKIYYRAIIALGNMD